MKNAPRPASNRRRRPTSTVDAKSIVKRYSDHSPLLDGENEQDFDQFQLACIKAIQPSDAIEEVWLMEFVNYTWEARRLRRVKVELIRSSRKEALSQLLLDLGERIYTSDDLVQNWCEGKKDAVDDVQKILKTHGLDQYAINAKAYQLIIKDLELLDKLIASYDFRRDKALRELEQRRDNLARRAREFADSVQEAEYVDIPRAANK